MRDDPFIAVKAQLDSQARWWNEQHEESYHRIGALKAALETISNIDPDDKGNSTKLAIATAQQAIKDDNQY